MRNLFRVSCLGLCLSLWFGYGVLLATMVLWAVTLLDALRLSAMLERLSAQPVTAESYQGSSPPQGWLLAGQIKLSSVHSVQSVVDLSLTAVTLLLLATLGQDKAIAIALLFHATLVFLIWRGHKL